MKHEAKDSRTVETKLPTLYSTEDLKKILKMFRENSFEELKLKTLVWLYFWTGMRYSEGLLIRYKDVDLDTAMLYLRYSSYNGLPRHIYIPKVLRPLLSKYMRVWERKMELRRQKGLEITKFLFFRINRDEKIAVPYKGHRGYYSKLRRRAEKSGVKQFNINTLRRTLIWNLVVVGGIRIHTVCYQIGKRQCMWNGNNHFFPQFYDYREELEQGYTRIAKQLLGWDKNDKF